MHKPSSRLVPGADTAVLFVHGIVGTPDHFRVLMPLEALVPEEWSFCNVLLPGHGGSVEDFGRSSMEAWRSQVKVEFLKLAETHRRIVVVAHSMGTLFALRLAAEYPDRVFGLFLLAVPLRIGLRLSGIVNIVRVGFGAVRQDHPLEMATLRACGTRTTKKLWKYIPWIPRFLELFNEIHETERGLDKLSVPCIVWQSGKDELVSGRSKTVLARFPAIELRELKDSSHFYYSDTDREQVLCGFKDICEKKKHD